MKGPALRGGACPGGIYVSQGMGAGGAGQEAAGAGRPPSRRVPDAIPRSLDWIPESSTEAVRGLGPGAGLGGSAMIGKLLTESGCGRRLGRGER